jgi:hypothetical protein
MRGLRLGRTLIGQDSGRQQRGHREGIGSGGQQPEEVQLVPQRGEQLLGRAAAAIQQPRWLMIHLRRWACASGQFSAGCLSAEAPASMPDVDAMVVEQDAHLCDEGEEVRVTIDVDDAVGCMRAGWCCGMGLVVQYVVVARQLR